METEGNLKLVVVAIVPLLRALGLSGFAWLTASGVFYMVEIIFYVLDSRITHAHGVWRRLLSRCAQERAGDLRSPGLLSFPQAGTTLALDFPQVADLMKLFNRLDAIVREAGGRLYPAKDAHMSTKDFKNGYPAGSRLKPCAIRPFNRDSGNG